MITYVKISKYQEWKTFKHFLSQGLKTFYPRDRKLSNTFYPRDRKSHPNENVQNYSKMTGSL
jgi:hypothetical protein